MEIPTHGRTRGWTWGWVPTVKNDKNKNTQTNKLIISTILKETNLKYEMVIKWVKGWGNPKVCAKKLKRYIKCLSLYYYYFIFNFWRTKIFSYKLWNKIPFSLFIFSTKKVKTVLLSRVQKKKKTVILTIHLYFVFIYTINKRKLRKEKKCTFVGKKKAVLFI